MQDVVALSEEIVQIDGKGRILIPAKVRKEVGLGNIARLTVRGREVVLKPVEDPLSKLERIVIKGTKDVEQEMKELRRTAERELQKEVVRRVGFRST